MFGKLRGESFSLKSSRGVLSDLVAKKKLTALLTRGREMPWVKLFEVVRLSVRVEVARSERRVAFIRLWYPWKFEMAASVPEGNSMSVCSIFVDVYSLNWSFA